MGLRARSSAINLHVQVVMPVTSGNIRHLSVRVRERLKRDRTSHFFQYLTQSEECRRHCSETCCSVLDTAPNRYQLLLNEPAHMRWENPSLKKHLKHAELTLIF